MREVKSINIREVRRQGHAKEWTLLQGCGDDLDVEFPDWNQSDFIA
jgi:hypothetical protein